MRHMRTPHASMLQWPLLEAPFSVQGWLSKQLKMTSYATP